MAEVKQPSDWALERAKQLQLYTIGLGVKTQRPIALALDAARDEGIQAVLRELKAIVHTKKESLNGK